MTRSATPPLAEDARERLLGAGLRLFAAQGFAKTSTREIAEAANVNVAAISYYFGDKAGLYRAVFFGPAGNPPADTSFARPDAPLPEVLQGFFEQFLAPLRAGDSARLCMKLRFREMFEPTGLWEEELRRDIGPMHDALAARLAAHLGLAAPDEEVVRLTVVLAALGVHLHVGHDVNEIVAPALAAGDDAMDRWAEALLRYGLALVEAEVDRRRAAATGAPTR